MMHLPYAYEPWMESADCTQVDPEVFFPDKGSPALPAKRVCLGCEVRVECLEYALERGLRHGIWGGLAERERDKVRRNRRAAARRADTPSHDAA